MKIGGIESIHPARDRERPRKDLVPSRQELLKLRSLKIPTKHEEKRDEIVFSEKARKILREQADKNQE